MTKPVYSILSAFLLLSSTAFAGPVEDRAKIEAAAEQYGKIFENYLEVCGVTRYMPKRGEAGGEFGHTVMYFKGACRDESAPYPKIKVCGPEGGGVGISMDSDYSNIHWTTVGSRSFMFYGNLPADAPLTDKEFNAAIDEAVRQRIFRGVRLQEHHDTKLRRGESYERYVARWSIGTNFAVNFARSSYCVRVPLIPTKGDKNSMVKSLVDYFNALNTRARSEGTGYSGITNNCTHIAHNALAHLGFWAPKETRWEEPAGLGWLSSHVKANLSVPFNTMMDAMIKGGGSAESFSPNHIADTDSVRKGFYKYRWMGPQFGSTIEIIPVHGVQNDKYATNQRPHLLDASTELSNRFSFGSPSPNQENPRFMSLIKQAQYNDLKANFKYWQRKYANDARTNFGGSSYYPDLAPAVSSYLKAQQAMLAEKMKLLEQLEAPKAAEAPAAAPAAAQAQAAAPATR